MKEPHSFYWHILDDLLWTYEREAQRDRLTATGQELQEWLAHKSSGRPFGFDGSFAYVLIWPGAPGELPFVEGMDPLDIQESNPVGITLMKLMQVARGGELRMHVPVDGLGVDSDLATMSPAGLITAAAAMRREIREHRARITRWLRDLPAGMVVAAMQRGEK